MKRSEAFWILNEMYELANEAQKQALAIAQRDIEFVDFMPDVPVQRWIPVTERLPEPFALVLVEMPGEKPFKTVREGFISRDGVWHSALYDREPGEVTHWMPLPEPPKENEK